MNNFLEKRLPALSAGFMLGAGVNVLFQGIYGLALLYFGIAVFNFYGYEIGEWVGTKLDKKKDATKDVNSKGLL